MTPEVDARALAAQALARIVQGRSLRAEYAAAAPRLGDVRDRALLSALLHAGARWWLRYAAAAARLLQRPLPARDGDVVALIVLGLVQVEVMQLPAYAAVAASVEAARALGKPRLAGVVNAVLRRWQRERAALAAELDGDAVTRSAHPRWLLDAFAADWPQQCDAIVAANNAQAPLWLRVNRRRAERAAVQRDLQSAGIEAVLPPAAADAVLLSHSAEVTALPGFAGGRFSVQDGAAQCAAGLIDLRAGQRVLDACAAPGGKSAHLLEHADVQLVALDRDAQRVLRMRENFARLGLPDCAHAGDAAQPQGWWDGRAFDRIVLDAPCSASGVIRRQPDIRLHRRASDIGALAQQQGQLLDALWPLLAPGGRLLYATCSVLDAENSAQIERLLARQSDARAADVAPDGWRAARAGAQNLPGEHAMDGFFYAVVEKHR